jgi:hypothetical protein
MMAVLINADRAAVWASLMTDNTEVCSITKTDLRAAVNAIDDFLEANATAINNTLPAAAKAGLSVAQKARLLSYVVRKRWGG